VIGPKFFGLITPLHVKAPATTAGAFVGSGQGNGAVRTHEVYRHSPLRTGSHPPGTIGILICGTKNEAHTAAKGSADVRRNLSADWAVGTLPAARSAVSRSGE
jgi:hypothetical protein